MTVWEDGYSYDYYTYTQDLLDRYKKRDEYRDEIAEREYEEKKYIAMFGIED